MSLSVSTKIFRALLSAVLTISFIVSPLHVYAQPLNQRQTKVDPMQSMIDTLDESDAKDFLSNAKPLKDFTTFKATDSFLDQDPFFLRSQVWTSPIAAQIRSLEDSVSVQTLKTKKGLSVLLGTSAVWNLNQAVTDAFQTDEYLFLTADNAKIFDDKIQAGTNEKTQGVFIVRHADILARSQGSNAATLQARVPVFFYPLVGTGWTSGQTRLDEVSGTGIILASNKSEKRPMPIDLKVVEQLIQIQLLNMNLAAQLNLLDPQIQNQISFAMQARLAPAYPLPPRGSTAGFGTLYSGLNLDRPNLSMFKSAGLSLEFDTKLLLAKTSNLFLPQAHAFIDFGMLDSSIIQKMIQSAYMIGGLAVLALLLKQTVLKEKLLEFYPESKNAPTIWQRAKGQSKAYFTTLSQTVTTAWTGLYQSPEYGIEYTSDKYLTKLAASKNSWGRKFLEKTVIFSRGANQGLPSDWRTLFLGVVIFGLTDTLHVLAQLVWVIPWAITGIADASTYMGMNELANLSRQAVDHGNSSNFVTNEFFRNFIAYILIGTLHLAQETKGMVMQTMKPIIEKEMMRDGIDPHENAAEFKRRFNKVLNLAFKKRDIPEQDKIMIDTVTVIENVTKKAGYVIEPEVKKEFAQINNNEEMSSPLEKSRWGLVLPALKLAEKSLIEQMGTTGSTKAQAALEIIQKMRNDYHIFLKNMSLKNALTEADKKAGFNVRKWMTMVTYEGSTEEFIKVMPKEWSSLDPESAQIAAITLRLSFWQLFSGRSLLTASKISSLSYKEKALSLVKDIQDPYLHQVAVNMKMRQLENEEKKKIAIASYTPPKQDWLGKRQIEKAAAVTFKIMAKKEQEGPPTSEQALAERKQEEKRIFAKALAEQVGISFQKQSDEQDFLMKLRKESHQYSAAQFFEKLHTEMYPKLSDTNKQLFAQAEAIARKKISDQEMINPPTDQAEVAQHEKTSKKIFIDELAKQMKVYLPVEGQENFLGEVEELAQEKTKLQFATHKDLQNYHNNLKTAEEKNEFEKQIYALNYLEAYQTVADSDLDVYASNSLERPGFWQKVRQSKLVRSSKAFTQAFRITESFTDNSALSLGADAWAKRNIPLYSDLKNGIGQTLKMYLSSVTYKYMIGFHVFGLTFSYPAYMFFIGTFFIGHATAFWLNRLMLNMGLKPMEGILSKTKFATVFSYATAIGYIPFMIFQKPVSKFLNENLLNPISSGVSSVKNGAVDGANFMLQNGQQALDACSQLLMGL